AQAQLDAAVARISDPSKDPETGLANGIDGQHRQISRLLWEIGQLGQQLRNTTILAKSYAQFEPTQARAVVQAQLADVNGQGGKPSWVGEGPTALPALSAAQQQVA